MDPISNQQMGNATSIFNLMRNIGGSMGIAISTTLVSRFQQSSINRLGAHVTPYNTQTQMMLQNMRDALIARGADSVTATRQSEAAIYGLVRQQAAILSFLHVFRVLGILFLLMIPLLLWMKRPTTRRTAPVH